MQNGTDRKVISTAYVDDVNTHHHLKPNESIDMITAMIRDYKRWKNILEASGGKIATEKCTYYAIDWEFSRGGKPEMKNLKLATAQKEDKSFNVKRIRITGFHKSLGHLVSPKDSGQTQITQLEKYAIDFKVSYLKMN